MYTAFWTTVNVRALPQLTLCEQILNNMIYTKAIIKVIQADLLVKVYLIYLVTRPLLLSQRMDIYIN